MKLFERNSARVLAVAVAMALPVSALADDRYEKLEQQMRLLQEQLSQVQQELKEYKQEMAVKETQVEKEVTTLKEDVAKAEEWKHPDTLVHMAGYADVGYTSVSGGDGSFGAGRFAPIFHYQYRDKVMLESELEFTMGESGETDVVLEYLTIDYFLNDYIALVAGKFLSPIGQFRQNLHPSWINKLASAPPGFGHDGAAPASEVGLQARGGFQLGGTFANYAAYIGNGPSLNSVFEDGEFELEGIVAEGLGRDADGEKVIGGRFGILPLPGMEIGVSAAFGKATVTAVEGGAEHAEIAAARQFAAQLQSIAPGPVTQDPGAGDPDGGDPGFDLHDEKARSYDVFGIDFVYNRGGFQLRGEYIKSKVGAANVGITASAGASWESWYTQASWLIPQTAFEPVIRYTDFDSPHASQDQTQWAAGINYLISSNVIAKMTYEFNSGQKGSMSDLDRWLLQLAYGF